MDKFVIRVREKKPEPPVSATVLLEPSYSGSDTVSNSKSCLDGTEAASSSNTQQKSKKETSASKNPLNKGMYAFSICN